MNVNWRLTMTLIKSILLGSAAGIVAVASAQAADLPTRKAAPVDYVKICNVGGITGWVLPGSDTCVKLSGYMTAQFTGGNLSTQYNWAGSVFNSLYGSTLPSYAVVPTSQRILVQGSDFQKNSTFYRDATGWTTRANFGFDFASNTAYGPLIGHMDFNGEMGNGFDTTGTSTYVNTGYLTWAGITAGKAQSFYSFVGGGDNWANFFSPDRKGFNEPALMAYTASFGGGFSATISAESPGGLGGSGSGTRMTEGSVVYGGQRWPDIVGALHVKQGWGEAQVSGVIHNVNVHDQGYYGTAAGPGSVIYNLGDSCGFNYLQVCNASENKVGWGIDAGVKFNLPWASGDNILFTGSYTQNAVWYSGLPDGMWGENGQVNGNGQSMYMSDAFFNPLTNQWAKPTAWSVTGLVEHHWTPTFYTDLEASIGGLDWSNQGNGGCYFLGAGTCIANGVNNLATGAISPHAFSWIVGADIGWNPVTNLNFDLELMYQSTTQDKPSGFLGTVYNYNGLAVGAPGSTAVFVPGAWEGNSSGFAGRLRITRYF
jgi:Porin subfamily